MPLRHGPSLDPRTVHLLVTTFDRGPGDAEGGRFVVSSEGVVERLAKDVLGVRRQMAAHGRRKIVVGCVRHSRKPGSRTPKVSSAPVTSPGSAGRACVSDDIAGAGPGEFSFSEPAQTLQGNCCA
jgi:hypothetical protein